jgi:hypothetical protein
MPFSKSTGSVWGLAQRGDAAALDALLHSERTSPGERTWALEVAARNDHVDAVAVLLRHGPLVEASEQDRVTVFGPLQWAAIHGSYRAAAVLLNARADVDRFCQESGGWVSGSMCSAAAKMGHVHMVALAVEAGANVHALAGYQKCSPIHIAARQGQTEVIEYLLRVKVSVHHQNGEGETCLEIAASRGHEPAVALLLAAKASVLQRRNGRSALDLACGVVGNLGVVERLLAAGSAVDADGLEWWIWTPLRSAAHDGDAKVVARLLRARACVDAQTLDGWTALSTAAYRMTRGVMHFVEQAKICRRVVDVLLRAKACVDEHTFLGQRTTKLLAERYYGTGAASAAPLSGPAA